MMREAGCEPNSWTTFQIGAGLVVTADKGRPALDPVVEQRVSEIWAQAIAHNPDLFNGDVFSIDRITHDRMSGHWTEYRRIVAQASDISLRPALDLCPLAVAGLIETPDGIVFGQRSAKMVYQPSMWQLAPAGNVDPSAARDGYIDLAVTLATELREELGLTYDSVAPGRAICAVKHARLEIVDVCIAMRTALRAPDLAHHHATHGDGEYPRIAVVARHDLPEFLAGRDGPVAPQTRLFLRAYGLPVAPRDGEAATGC